MDIALCGLALIAWSALMARPGFFIYCIWRGTAEKSVDIERVYSVAKARLLSAHWLSWTLFTTLLICLGLWILSKSDTTGMLEFLGILAFLSGFGLIIGFHILRAGRIWRQAVSEISFS